MIAFACTFVRCVLFKDIKFLAGIQQISQVRIITQTETSTVYNFFTDIDRARFGGLHGW